MNQQPFYQLRPNKYIDRSIFLQNLLCLNKIYPLEKHSYIGFGSYLFADFKLIHETLNITDMISLECDPDVYERAKFNKPYNCIKIVNASSTEFISNFPSEEKNYIIWLDYVTPGELGEQFSDFCGLLNVMQPYDIIKITLNANPGSLGTASQKEMHESRLNNLRTKIDHYLPEDASKNDVTLKKYPILLLNSLRIAALETLKESCFQKNFLFPLSSSIYKDGQQMVTFTGIILDDHEKENQIKRAANKYPFLTFSWNDPCNIKVPILTLKEILHINNLLPDGDAKQQIEEKYPFLLKSVENIDSYLFYYKHYPHFHSITL